MMGLKTLSSVCLKRVRRVLGRGVEEWMGGGWACGLKARRARRCGSRDGALLGFMAQTGWLRRGLAARTFFGLWAQEGRSLGSECKLQGLVLAPTEYCTSCTFLQPPEHWARTSGETSLAIFSLQLSHHQTRRLLAFRLG